jgi:hypothetical protein
MNLKRYVFRTIISVAFIVSILFNLFYLIDLSNRPSYQLGILAQDISVADFSMIVQPHLYFQKA